MRSRFARVDSGYLCCYGTLQPRYYITCAGRSDGGGAQIQAIFSTLLYAHCVDIVYLHSPITSVEHNSYNDPHWAAHWEHVFSPGYGELQSSEIDLAAMRIVPAGRLQVERSYPPPTEPILLVASECHQYADAHPDFYSLIQPRLRQKYARNTGPAQWRRDRISVAVHVRRGDVTQQDCNRYTPIEAVHNQLVQLRRILAPIPLAIHVYSEGVEGDFDRIRGVSVLHLNGDVFECLHALIHADILVMAKSSLSYTAALLSRGIVIYSRFWHAPLQQWVTSDEAGNIPEPALRLALSRQLLLRTTRFRPG